VTNPQPNHATYPPPYPFPSSPPSLLHPCAQVLSVRWYRPLAKKVMPNTELVVGRNTSVRQLRELLVTHVMKAPPAKAPAPAPAPAPTPAPAPSDTPVDSQAAGTSGGAALEAAAAPSATAR
jgi:hypothetical protein